MTVLLQGFADELVKLSFNGSLGQQRDARLPKTPAAVRIANMTHLTRKVQRAATGRRGKDVATAGALGTAGVAKGILAKDRKEEEL